MSTNLGAPTAIPAIDAQAMRKFFDALFLLGDWVNIRALPDRAEDKGKSQPQNFHYQMGGDFQNVISYAQWCVDNRNGMFVVPGAVRAGGTKTDDVLTLSSVLADLDSGPTLEKLAKAETLIGGPASMVVVSGGVTETHDPRLHVYFLLDQVATGADVAAVASLRGKLAQALGDDPSFKRTAQVIRVAGSIWWKGEPRLVALHSAPLHRYSHAAIASALGAAPRATAVAAASNILNFFDFNTAPARQESAADGLRDTDIQTEGKSGVTRWEAFNKVAGKEIADARAGRKTLADARAYVLGWIAQHFERPEEWEARADREFEALMRVDVQHHGPIAPPPAEAAREWRSQFDKWTATAFQGAPPPRPWLIDGVLPLGVPGMLAARGGLGKSYLIADLALLIATGAPVRTGLDFNEHLILGGQVAAHGTVVVFMAEDDHTTVHERLVSLDPEGRRFDTPDRLRLIPLPDTGGARPLFRSATRGSVEPTAELEEIWTWLRSLPDLRLVVFDPLQAFVAADITGSPEAGQFVCSALGALAAETGAAVLVTHHVKKTERPVASAEGLRDAIRGTTALVDGLRWVYGLWEIDTEGRDDEACAKGAVVKANLKTCRQEHHYRRAPSGALRQIAPTIIPNRYAMQLDALEKAIIAAAAAGYPFMYSGPNGLYEERHRLPEGLQSATKALFEKLGKDLLNARRIVKGTAKGSKARGWLDGPEGLFATGCGVLFSGAPNASGEVAE